MTNQISPDQTPQGWDSVVGDYEQAVESGLTGQFVEEALAMAGVTQGDDVLDVAAGPGVMAIAAAHKGANVLATDFAPMMVERLSTRVADLGLSSIRAAVMDGQALDAEDESFDVVCSNFGVIFFPEPDRAFQEMHRVLRSGGRAVVTAWSSPEKFEPLQLMVGGIRQVIPDFVPASPPVWLQFQDPAVLQQAMERAGLGQVEVRTLPGSWDLPSIAWLKENLLNLAPAVQALFTQFDEDQKAAMLEQMGEILAVRFGDAPPKLAVEAHIALARKQ